MNKTEDQEIVKDFVNYTIIQMKRAREMEEAFEEFEYLAKQLGKDSLDVLESEVREHLEDQDQA